MAWRIQLSNRPIQRLDILSGQRSLLAAWPSPKQVHYFDLQHGTKLDHLNLAEPESPDRDLPAWAEYQKTLTAPNEVTLPVVKGKRFTFYSSANRAIQLIQDGAAFTLNVNGSESPLELEPNIEIARIAMDRTVGLLAFLDYLGRVHIYHRHLRVGIFDTNLAISSDSFPQLIVADGGAAIMVGNGLQIAIFEPDGRIKRRYTTHFPYGVLACSPDSRSLALSDLDSGVIRIYNASNMLLTHQRFAVDLLADAKRAQLLPVTITTSAAISTLAITNKGALAFSTMGLVCVSNLSRMKLIS